VSSRMSFLESWLMGSRDVVDVISQLHVEQGLSAGLCLGRAGLALLVTSNRGSLLIEGSRQRDCEITSSKYYTVVFEKGKSLEVVASGSGT
jgi:hypothetical protein